MKKTVDQFFIEFTAPESESASGMEATFNTRLNSPEGTITQGNLAVFYKDPQDDSWQFSDEGHGDSADVLETLFSDIIGNTVQTDRVIIVGTTTIIED